jgi:hypothetical protein
VSKWSRMDLAEFHRSGLLWHVNQAVLWPLGLALTVDRDGDEYHELFVQRIEPFDAISDGATDEEREEHINTLRDWMKGRMTVSEAP